MLRDLSDGHSGSFPRMTALISVTRNSCGKRRWNANVVEATLGTFFIVVNKLDIRAYVYIDTLYTKHRWGFSYPVVLINLAVWMLHGN